MTTGKAKKVARRALGAPAQGTGRPSGDMDGLLERFVRLERHVSSLTVRFSRLLNDRIAQATPIADSPFDLTPLVESPDVEWPRAAARPLPGGLKDSVARGEAVRLGWIQDGTLVEAKTLASAWGLTTQALGAAAKRDEVFTFKVANRLFYPGVFQRLERDKVAAVCKALAGLSPAEKLVFWLREHGGLAGRSVEQALQANTATSRIMALAQAWADERKAPNDSEA